LFSEGFIMVNKLTLFAGGLVFALTLGMLASRGAQASPTEHTLYVTFGQPVMIPGTMLMPGAYIFEEAQPDEASNLVRVLSRDRKHVFLTQYAARVARPRSISADQTIVLGEAQPNEPEQIVSWFEPGNDLGYAFNYHGY
jgi:hypothetical protein